MKIAIGADHAGFKLKKVLKEHLKAKGFNVLDEGTHSENSADYPEFALKVAKEVSIGEADFGVLICGTGTGMSIVANKVPGIKCAVVYDEYSAKIAKSHNKANIISLGARTMTEAKAKSLLDIFLDSEFEGGRHQRRVVKVEEVESGILLDTLRSLRVFDSDVFNAILSEMEKQEYTINLIASENMTSFRVLSVMANPMSNKYAEGYPGRRYYGGCEFVDIVEEIAKERAKELFHADFANVQPHSGTQANQAVYLAFMEPGDTFLGMDLTCGGHLSHGSPVNFSGKIYRASSYKVHPETYLIDFDMVRDVAKREKPKVIVAGGSSYPRAIDFKAFKEIADEVGAILLADIAHPAGLVATGLFPTPVPYADVVTMTTHKTLRGPRGGLIVGKSEHEKNVNSALFPGAQGGPMMHVIAAKAVCFKEALTQGFREYQMKVLENARELAIAFQELGYNVVTGGTDSHIVLLDIQDKGLAGGDAEKALYKAGIVVNKNVIPYDKRPPVNPSGLRLGTPSVTTRGMGKEELKLIARLIDSIIKDQSEDNITSVRKEVIGLCESFQFYKPVLVALR